MELGPELRVNDAKGATEPPLLRSERVSALQKAMLAAATFSGASAATHIKTLAALGFTTRAALRSPRAA